MRSTTTAFNAAGSRSNSAEIALDKTKIPSETDAKMVEGAPPLRRPLMPPHLVRQNFLPEDTAEELVQYAIARQSTFKPTKVGRPGNGRVDLTTRLSLGTRDLGKFKPILKSKLLGLVSDVVANLRTTAVRAPKFEFELVAHNDGAFFARHTDIQRPAEEKIARVLSGVYYFYARPKAFTGGALRLFALFDPAAQTFTDIEPTHNHLVVFPSWAPHEVMPITCPSKQFADLRFAINCWIYSDMNQGDGIDP